MGKTGETSKMLHFLVSSIVDGMDDGSIRTDHPLQRESMQWDGVTKSNLISSILHQDPIPAPVMAEQVCEGGVCIKWVLDGKQRFTNIAAFRLNCLRIGRSVERPIVKYQVSTKLDDGTITYEMREFDVRGKMYKDLPKELQKIFDGYTVDVTYYMEATPEDIEYHIRRYNRCKPMTSTQKGITHLGEDLATVVRRLKNHRFFMDGIGFTPSNRINGSTERVVIESVMASSHIDNWRSSQEKMCDYLKTDGLVSDFDEFEDSLNRLVDVIDDEVGKYFNAKDSFLWITLFSRFKNLGIDDMKFRNFLLQFFNNEIDRTEYDSISSRSTKDKSIIVAKLDALEKIMKVYLFGNSNCKEADIEKSSDNETSSSEEDNTPEVDLLKEETVVELGSNDLFDTDLRNNSSEINNKEISDEDTQALIRYIREKRIGFIENMDMDVQEFLHETLSLCESEDDCECILDTIDKISLEFSDDSPMYKRQNMLSLLYSYKWIYDGYYKIEQISSWISEFVSKEKYLSFDEDLRKNAEKMKNDYLEWEKGAENKIA